MNTPDSPILKNDVDMLAQRIESHRRKSAEFFEERQARWDSLQSRLLEALNNVTAGIDAWDNVGETVEQRHLEVRKERQRLERDRVELEERSCELDEQQIEIEANRKRIQKELEQQKREMADAAESRQSEMAAEIESLQHQLQELDKQADDGEVQELRNQLESAAENLRTLEQQNESLQSQLNEPATPAPLGGAFDWEAQKAQLMQSSDEMPPLDRLTVNKALEVTSRVVEAKEKELAAMREQLAERLTTEVPTSNPAVSDDEAILEERKRLKELQVELREKAREAEVAIAVERAENARSRAKLEEKMRELENQARMLAKFEKENVTGRRWMDHLGLGNKDGDSK